MPTALETLDRHYRRNKMARGEKGLPRDARIRLSRPTKVFIIVCAIESVSKGSKKATKVTMTMTLGTRSASGTTIQASMAAMKKRLARFKT